MNRRQRYRLKNQVSVISIHTPLLERIKQLEGTSITDKSKRLYDFIDQDLAEIKTYLQAMTELESKTDAYSKAQKRALIENALTLLAEVGA